MPIMVPPIVRACRGVTIIYDYYGDCHESEPHPGLWGKYTGLPRHRPGHRAPGPGLCAGTSGKTVIVTSASRRLFPADPGARRFKEE